MILRHLFHRDLAQASYLVGCAATGEALIVDPNRDVGQYIDLAEREGLRITAVTETHIHADYVSGSRELVARTGATLYLSDAGTADWKYAFASDSDATLIREGDTIMVGNIRIDVWHTPGHTPEHLAFLVTDTAGADRPMGIFTGDFVFVGDVGRPDLLEKAAGIAGTQGTGARELFRSIQRFKTLPDFVQIWPGHGAGSACGKALGAVPQTTVGYERLFNWAFQVESEDAFVDEVTADQPEPPVYFAEMKRVNKEGPALVNELPDPRPASLSDLEAALAAGDPIVDVRPADTYADGHIPGTINISYGPGFVTWAGWLLPYDRPFYLIAGPVQIEEITRELRMIGLDSLTGYAAPDVLDQWTRSGKDLETLDHVTVDDLSSLGEYEVIDVRGAAEYAGGHIPESRNIPLGYIRERIEQIPADRPVVFQCQSGRRSAVAASVAAAQGRSNVRNLAGGLNAWEQAGAPVEREEEPAHTTS